MRGGQVMRWWSLLRALERARRGLTADELMELDLGCTRRTLYRDLEQLQEVAPIVKEDGRYRLAGSAEGAWSVSVDPTMVLSLMLSQDLLAPLQGTVLVEPLQELRARLLPMLKPQVRAYLEELRTSLLGTTLAAPSYASSDPVIRALQEGLGRQHRVRITYRNPGQPVRERVVEPYFTWVMSGRLYLVGFALDREDVRTFAVQRIQTAEVLDEAFEPDPKFDPAEFVRRGFGVYHGAIHRVALEFDPAVAYVARERTWHRSQRLRERPGGGVRLTMDAAGLPEIAAWVASFGGRVRPVAPEELVERVRELHARGLAALSHEPVTSEVTTLDDKPPH
jgi:predicted DNA-binding transcriptional regulator YafY